MVCFKNMFQLEPYREHICECPVCLIGDGLGKEGWGGGVEGGITGLGVDSKDEMSCDVYKEVRPW